MKTTANAEWKRTKQAAILVGGKGTRLGSLTQYTPKPLMEIDEEHVFLDDVIANFARQGFDDILLLAGHMFDQVVERYDGKTVRGAQIRVVVENTPAGTAGALMNAAHLLDETFVLANGDTLFDINVRRLDALFAANEDSIGVMALRHVENAGRYGSVELLNSRIVSFREKAADSPDQPGLINAGIGIFSRRLLALITHLPCSIEAEIYPRLVVEEKMLGLECSGYFIDIGLPETLTEARETLPARRRRPALFLDRDGVINYDGGYTHRVDDLRFIDGAVETIRRANDIGAYVFVVTNQAGVAHGLYDIAAVNSFHEAIQTELAREGAFVDAFYICPFHPEAKDELYRHENHPDRKPNPGMLLRAMREWPVDREESLLIGDMQTDIQAASKAGVSALLFQGGNVLSLAASALDEMDERVAFKSNRQSGRAMRDSK